MKTITYIMTGCLILGMCTIKAHNTITEDNKHNSLTKAQTVLNNTKNAYWDCLEYTSCDNCDREYENMKTAYDVYNKIK